MIKNCSSHREKLLKFKAEGWEFAKVLRSLEQFIQTVKGEYIFWSRMVSQIKYITIRIQIGKNWDLESKVREMLFGIYWNKNK